MNWKILCGLILLLWLAQSSHKPATQRLLKKHGGREQKIGWDHEQYLEEFQARMKKKAKHLRRTAKRIRLKLRRCEEKCKDLEGEAHRDCKVRKSKLKIILDQLRKRLKRTYFRLANGDHEEPPPEDLEVKIRREKAARKLKQRYDNLETKYKELKKKHYALKKERQEWIDKYREKSTKLDKEYRHLRDDLMAKHLQMKAEYKQRIKDTDKNARKKNKDEWDMKKMKMQEKMSKQLQDLKGDELKKAKERQEMLQKIEMGQQAQMDEFAAQQKKERLEVMANYRDKQKTAKPKEQIQYHHKHDNLLFDLDAPFNQDAFTELHHLSGISEFSPNIHEGGDANMEDLEDDMNASEKN